MSIDVARRVPDSFWDEEPCGERGFDLKDLCEDRGFEVIRFREAGGVNTRREAGAALQHYGDRALYAGKRFDVVVAAGRLILRGLSHKTISRETGVARSTVAKIERFMRSRGWRESHHIDRVRIAELRARGLRNHEIRARTGAARDTISKLFSAARAADCRCGLPGGHPGICRPSAADLARRDAEIRGRLLGGLTQRQVQRELRCGAAAIARVRSELVAQGLLIGKRCVHLTGEERERLSAEIRALLTSGVGVWKVVGRGYPESLVRRISKSLNQNRSNQDA